jgi:hypothetical protein
MTTTTSSTSTPTEKEGHYFRRSKSITSPEQREEYARIMAQPFEEKEQQEGGK